MRTNAEDVHQFKKAERKLCDYVTKVIQAT